MKLKPKEMEEWEKRGSSGEKLKSNDESKSVEFLKHLSQRRLKDVQGKYQYGDLMLMNKNRSQKIQNTKNIQQAKNQ